MKVRIIRLDPKCPPFVTPDGKHKRPLPGDELEVQDNHVVWCKALARAGALEILELPKGGHKQHDGRS